VRIVRVATLSALLAIGAAMQSSGQNAVQLLAVTMTAVDQPTPTTTKAIRFTSKDLIRYFTGSNVVNGQLFLVTPLASGALTNTGNMNSFLRITQGKTTVMEVQTPDSFNFFQDAVSTSRSRFGITSYGTDRYSLDFGGFHAELQTFNTWSTMPVGLNPIFRTLVPDGTGSFTSSTVTGEGTIDGVTQPGVPMLGSISGGTPVAGP
jgi:hypothetical protein